MAHKLTVTLISVAVSALLMLAVCLSSDAQAQTSGAGIAIPKISVEMKDGSNPGEVVGAMRILLILTVLTMAPALFITMTAFTRIVIVMFFLRQALGTQYMPPSQVLIGLSLFLTLFVMKPVFVQINDNALQPFMNEQIGLEQALDSASEPLKRFMLSQTREKDLGVFLNAAGAAKPSTAIDIPMHIVVPAFITSELKTSFQIGFLIYLPFLILDMVVASILMAMGMMMLPPVIISMPFKIMLFVLVDGWTLIVGSIIKSFAGAG